MSDWMNSEYEFAYNQAQNIIISTLVDAVESEGPVDMDELQRGIDMLLELAESITEASL